MRDFYLDFVKERKKERKRVTSKQPNKTTKKMQSWRKFFVEKKSAGRNKQPEPRATLQSPQGKESKSSTSPPPEDPLIMGISFNFLASLPVDPSASFHDVCTYVKEVTKNNGGYRSLAMHLSSQAATKHFVSNIATHFVSYAWSGGYGATMKALSSHFKETNPFVWMDLAIIDQHAAVETNINFEQWTKTFRESLVKIGQAVLVLTPGEKPIAIGRSWCCFEWSCITELGISFEYCVDPQDANELISRMNNGMGVADFNNLFAGIDVEKAQAFKPFDQESILLLMKQIGIVRVNDIVMKSLKEWLLKVNAEGVRRLGEEQTEAAASMLSSRGALHQALVCSPPP